MPIDESPMPRLQWHRSLQITRHIYPLQVQIPRRITIHTSIRPKLNTRFIYYGNRPTSVMGNSLLNATFSQPGIPWLNRKNFIGNNRDEIERQKRREKRCGGYDWCCSRLCASLWLFAFLLIIFGITALLVGLLVKSNATTTISTTTTTISATTSTTMTITTTTSATTTTTTAPYCATRVTFDDIPGQSSTSGVIPNGYKNLNWTNAYYLNVSTMPISGFYTALSSAPYVAYNPGGNPITITTANSTLFAFDSIMLASVWRDSLIYSNNIYRAGTLQLSGSFPLKIFNETTITCTGCSNYDTLYFNSSGGTPHPGLVGNDTEFAFDDLCISFGY